VTVLGADAADVLVVTREELDGLDDDGVLEELALEDRLLEDGVALGIALLERAGEAVAWGVEELAEGGGRCSGGGS